MLVQNYITNQNKIPNHDWLINISSAQTSFKMKWMEYPSWPFDIFDAFTASQIEILFDEQYAAAELEARELAKYDLLSQKSLQITLDQYQHIFFFEWLCYKKDALLNYIRNSERAQQAVSWISSILENTQKHQSSDNTNTYTISRQAIRDTVGFTFKPVPWWSDTKEQVYLEWQEEFMNSREDLIIVNGSRQIGKSFAIGELLIEESYEVGWHLWVFSFAQDTTDAIREYIREKIEILNHSYPQFTENKQKNFIKNTITWTRIYFVTLEGKGKRARGKTLRIAVVDEAQEADEDSIEGALWPTMTTTKGRIYLLGTPWPERDCYMYKKILEIRRWTEYNWPNQDTAKVIDVDVMKNPLINPRRREYVLRNKDKPNIQREYFCMWWAWQDKLFDPIVINSPSYTEWYTNDFIVLSIDPARKHDRSGYSVKLAGNWKIEQQFSWEVPASHKWDWNLQAEFFKNLISWLTVKFKNVYVVMDITGVGDWVAQIFKNKWIRIDMAIRYVAWDSESDTYECTRVGKSRLINYFLDSISTNVFVTVWPSNQLFLTELETISIKQSKWSIWMESHGFDDITNATMIGVYFIIRRWYHTRNMRSTEWGSTWINPWLLEWELYWRKKKTEYSATWRNW